MRVLTCCVNQQSNQQSDRRRKRPHSLAQCWASGCDAHRVRGARAALSWASRGTLRPRHMSIASIGYTSRWLSSSISLLRSASIRAVL